MEYLTIHKTKLSLATPTDIARLTAPKAAQFLYNILRVGPRVILRSAFELLRANTITRVLSAIILLFFDTINLARGRISFKQYIINLTLALLLLVGGTAGWELGNNAVSLILIENMVIGIVAGLIGAGILGALLAVSWDKIVKRFIRDDEADMMFICNQIFDSIIKSDNLTREQAKEAAQKIKITPHLLRLMFAEKDREQFARRIIEEMYRVDASMG